MASYMPPDHSHKAIALLLLVGFAVLLALYSLVNAIPHGATSSPPTVVATSQPGTSPPLYQVLYADANNPNYTNPSTATAFVATPDFEVSTTQKGTSMYQVTNPNNVELRVQHVYVDAKGRVLYAFFDSIPPFSASLYHMLDMPIPYDFNGQVRVYASRAVIVKNLGEEPTPTPLH